MNMPGEFDFSLHTLATGSDISTTSFNDSNAWFKVIIFLITLACIAFFLSFLSKKKNVDFTKSNKSRLRVIDTCSLGNRQFLAVAQYEKDRHLLAISNAGISYLTAVRSDSPDPISDPVHKSNTETEDKN